MKIYQSSELRNVAVVGHAHSGKTSLISAMLRAARMPVQNGRGEENGAVTAYDEEEQARHTTLANAVAYAEWSGVKVNMLDTPGFHMFLHEARAAMVPGDAAVVVLNAQAGLEPGTEKLWSYADELKLPRIIVLNQLDHPKADCLDGCAGLLGTLREHWGRQVVAVQLPIVDDGGFHGIVDLLTMKAFLYQLDGDGRGRVAEIPGTVAEQARAAHEALVELVAEGKDELLEEFFALGTLAEEHLVRAMHEAVDEDRIFPVLFASGLRQVGADLLLEFIRTYAPSPCERAEVPCRPPAPEGGEVIDRVDDADPLAIYVFKTLFDPFAGRISFFKVLRGSIRADVSVDNYMRGETERLAHISIMQGRRAVEVSELHAGDLGAVAKLRVTQTGDTLGAKGHPVFLATAPVPEPAMTFAIEPRSRADEDKLAPALHKLMGEDLLLRFYRDAQTGEFLLAGAGEPHIEVAVSRLRRRYHTEVTLKAPRVPYRETIRTAAQAQGRHKKQTGGHGQFGDCTIRIEPLARGEGFRFVDEIFGGAIPRQFIPAVEKGIGEAAARGFLAGYPVVDFQVTLLDGSYHDVDSNELSFKMAGRIAFRKCMEQARAALLEPVMRVEIEGPDAAAGALLGDLNGRRGRVQGMESSGAATTIRAEVPLAEMLGYGTVLTSLTQGRGSFRMEMDHYSLVPPALSEKIIANAKQQLAAVAAEE